jgi:hypothetical protein
MRIGAGVKMKERIKKYQEQMDCDIKANADDTKPEIPFGIEKPRNDHFRVQKINGKRQRAYP